MKIYPYGVMITIGVLVSGALGKWLAKCFCISFFDTLILFAYALLFGMSGGKLAYLILNRELYDFSQMSTSEVMRAISESGFIFYGGLLLGALGVFLAAKLHQIDLSSCLRVNLPLLPLAHGFGRIGCFLAGCCYGMPYDGFLSYTYRNSLVAPVDIPLFPVQLAEAVGLFLLALLLLRCLFRGMSVGCLCIVYVSVYAVMRFCLEFLRGDAARGFLFGLSTSQWVSIGCLAMILPSVLIYHHVMQRKRNDTES